MSTYYSTSTRYSQRPRPPPFRPPQPPTADLNRNVLDPITTFSFSSLTGDPVGVRNLAQLASYSWIQDGSTSEEPLIAVPGMCFPQEKLETIIELTGIFRRVTSCLDGQTTNVSTPGQRTYLDRPKLRPLTQSLTAFAHLCRHRQHGKCQVRLQGIRPRLG